ncbi:MAG: type II toxin-antitoxin system VapC family toxin [Thiothrix sp.]|nr:type II toxin-antitoxin system VapC family toxin [Thiothrix sp.]HPE60461.1 type II toxin-antitoxin system VapC family toxin [Thiolinea sp.]
MYLLDTNIISEVRKKGRTNAGVQAFFHQVREQGQQAFLSAVTIGELRRGIELLKHRNDHQQAGALETWLDGVLDGFRDCILPFDHDVAQLWGRLRVPNPENELDKMIAVTALIYDLTVVTRNTKHFAGCGTRTLDPFL